MCLCVDFLGGEGTVFGCVADAEGFIWWHLLHSSLHCQFVLLHSQSQSLGPALKPGKQVWFSTFNKWFFSAKYLVIFSSRSLKTREKVLFFLSYRTRAIITRGL